MELLTVRLRLRRPTADDVDLIHRLHADPRVCEHNPSDALTTRAEAAERFREWDEHWQRHGFGYWAVQAGATVGFCGLRVMRLRDIEVLNLCYRLAPSAWGDGVATEAATAVVAWAAEHRPGWPVIARIRPANAPSAAVAVHAGLRRLAYLDNDGEDGRDRIYARGWPDPFVTVTEPTFTARFLMDAPDDPNVNAWVDLPDGSTWALTIVTVDEVGRLLERWRTTGEVAGGAYFWATDQLVIPAAGVPAMTAAIRELVRSGEILSAGLRIEND